MIYLSRKRRGRQFSSMSAIYLAAIVSLSLVGVGYGHWSNGLNLDINLTTGNIDPQAHVADYSSLSISSSEDGRTIEISGDMYPGTYEDLGIKILDKGSIPVILEDISTSNSSEIVDFNHQSRMRSGLFSLSEDEVVEEFRLSIAPATVDYNDNILMESYSYTIEESLEEDDEIQRKINAIYEEIKQLENEIDRLNVIENHNFEYELLFIQGI